ncbi:hypothetical protein BpHYR1_022301 [Brachionus plicatilis]|uniref:Uncharacterized protein n=1 Tax=Brachionus plicatilis TaxID=10195 RepID=A0A3M7PEN7_BRAPC|nr:hypothetical protein BpHYR1_022301 [Brachionus plicatilis]
MLDKEIKIEVFYVLIIVDFYFVRKLRIILKIKCVETEMVSIRFLNNEYSFCVHDLSKIKLFENQKNILNITNKLSTFNMVDIMIHLNV